MTTHQIQQLFVGCFDVLGFKNLVATVPLPDLLARYQRLMRAVSGKPTAQNVVVVLGSTPDGELVGGRHVVASAIFSDTILLWSGEEWAAEFLMACSSLLAESVRQGLPLRGGIAFGPMVINPTTSTYLGQALVDAHVTEASQEWVGVGLHPSSFKSTRFGANLGAHQDVQPYAVPVKPQRAAIGHALTWQQYLHGTEAEDKLKVLMAAAPPDEQKKYTNAIAFVQQFP